LGFFFWWWLNSISIPSPHKLALFTTGMSCDRFIFGLQNSKAPVLQPVNDRQDPRLSEHEEGQPLLPQHLMHEERDPSICSISTVSTLKKKRSEMILVNLCFYSLHTSSYVVYLFRLLLSIYIYTHTVYVYYIVYIQYIYMYSTCTFAYTSSHILSCQYLPIYLPNNLQTYLPSYQPTYIPIYLSIYLPICLPVYLFICLSIYLFVRLSIYLSVCLSFCLFIYLMKSI
jgi:hypothetical protein